MGWIAPNSMGWTAHTFMGWIAENLENMLPLLPAAWPKHQSPQDCFPAAMKGGVPAGSQGTQDWWGKGEPQHSQAGGLGAQMWRQNMKGLKDMYFGDSLPMSSFLENLCLHVKRATGEKQGEWESCRNYLMRTKQQLAGGLTCCIHR